MYLRSSAASVARSEARSEMDVLRQDIHHYLVGCEWRFDANTGIAACVRDHMCGMYKIEGTKIEEIMHVCVADKINTTRWIFSDGTIYAQTDKGVIEVDSSGVVKASKHRVSAIKDAAHMSTPACATTCGYLHVFDYCGVSVRVSKDSIHARNCPVNVLDADMQSLLSYALILCIGENKYLCEDNSGRICICRITGDLRAALDEHI